MERMSEDVCGVRIVCGEDGGGVRMVCGVRVVWGVCCVE